MEPNNMTERTFNSLVGILGVCVFWWIFSFITLAILDSTDGAVDVNKQMWQLRRYLRECNATPLLTYRVLRFAEKECQDRQVRITEKSLTILSNLSEHLLGELRYIVGFNPINAHPLFDRGYKVSDSTIFNMAGTVLTEKIVADDDVIFKWGMRANHMLWLVSGQVAYDKGEGEDELELVNVGDWMGEASLWVWWTTKGTAQAAADSQLIVIDAVLLGKSIMTDEALLGMFANYAANFVDWVNAQDSEKLSDIYIAHKRITFFSSFLAARQTPSKNSKSEGQVPAFDSPRSNF